MAHAGVHIAPTLPRELSPSPNGPRPPSREPRRAAVDGAIVGFLSTLTLVAISFFAWKTAGLPFAPFDIFDFAVRLVPGSIVTAVIESTVALSRAVGVTNISVAAKAGDQTLAITAMLMVGIATGAGLFALLATTGEPALVFGGILGAMLGGLALMAERQLQRLAPGSMIPAAWVFSTFFVWGLAFGWVHDRLKRTTAEDAERSPHTSQRRRFLKILTGASVLVSAASLVAGVAVERLGRRLSGRRWSDDHVFPNAASPLEPLAGTRAEFTPIEDFYRIDTDTRAPALDATRWRLSIGGLVEREQAMTLDELRQLPSTDVFATLCCISNPPGGDLISTTRWTGVSLQRLLARLEVSPSATHLKITSADGFFESIAIDTIVADSRVMLAYTWDGVALPVEHGYPVRLYVPDVYGMKQPKWVVRLDAVARWEPGYWVSRGWSREGIVATMATIDAAKVIRREVLTVEAGGIAFAGSRGISKVEVRVDDEEWRTAELRPPLSKLSWVIWRATLPVAAGERTLTVRAVDGAGMTQQASFHSRRVTA